MVHVVTLQVDSLLAQYHAEPNDEPAIPAQLATMLQRAVDDIGTSLSSLQDRSHHLFHHLLMGEPKVSATYVRSLNEMAQTLRGMVGINNLMMGYLVTRWGIWSHWGFRNLVQIQSSIEDTARMSLFAYSSLPCTHLS